MAIPAAPQQGGPPMRGGAPDPDLVPWRDVVAPHPEVAGGRYAEAEFAADLGQVHAGGGGPAYADARGFFTRTYLTDGLRRLLVAAARRVSGGGGEPVVPLRTGFGGGKSHALLALYHLFGGTAPASELAGGPQVLEAAGLAALPAVRLAVLAGTDLSPGRPWTSRALAGRSVRTLWGELAAQLGGADGYAAMRDEDEQAVPPGAGALARLLDDHGPSVVLLDELVPFLRPLYARAGLSAGGFDAQLTFVQNLTEAAKRSRAGMVVTTLPASDAEIGGEGGRAAAERLAATCGRLQAAWRPVAPHEGAEVVRWRLFQAVRAPAAREATCWAFAQMYANGATAFPAACRAPAYADRLRATYPLHPELFDLLEQGWTSLEGFQGTRGLLRLLAAAVHALWQRGDQGALILPGSLPLDEPPVRDQWTRCLDPAWSAVVDRDVDGERSVPATIERENPRFARGQVARRIARTLFLGSAPPERRQAGGVDLARVCLGAREPRDAGALWADAVRLLRERLTYLYADGSRLWLDARPNLLREAADRAAAIPVDRAAEEVHRRLQAAARRRVDPGVVGGVHVAREGVDPPDDPVARLVVLPLCQGHQPPARGTSAAVDLAARLLEGRARHPNMVVFLAADAGEAAGVRDAARHWLAWAGLADEAARGVIQLDAYRRAQLERGQALAAETLRLRLHGAYQWLLSPVREGQGPIRWDATRVPGEDDPIERAIRRLREDGMVHACWSPAELGLALDRWLWADAPHAEVRRVWEALTRYLYLPRLAREGVLLDALARGVEAGAPFAYADGITPDGRYRGLRLGVAGIVPHGHGLIVKPGAARAQLAAEAAARDGERRAAPERAGCGAGPPRARVGSGPGGGAAGRSALTGVTGEQRAGGTEAAAAGGCRAEGDGAQPGGGGPFPFRAPDAAGAPVPADGASPRGPWRFRGTVALDPLRTAADAAAVAEEVVRHLVALAGAEVAVTLEIDARVAGGLPPGVVRVVRENAAALRFHTAAFAEEG